MNRRSTLLSVLVVLACGAVVGLQAGVSAADDSQPLRAVLVNLTAGPDDIQQASAALMLASNARDAGREVTLFLNVRAVELAHKDNMVAMYKRRTMFQASLQTMIAEGLQVVACPYSLKMAEMTEDDLIEGVVIPQEGDFIPALDTSAAVFSY